jgi:hypothetical protein
VEARVDGAWVGIEHTKAQVDLREIVKTMGM